MQKWRPADPFEEELAEAFAADDLARSLALLRTAELAVPISAAAAAGDEPPAWPTTTDAGMTWIMAYTSIEGMRQGTQGLAEYCRVVTLPELAAGWPDLRSGLVVNLGLPPHFFLESGTLARLAVPTMAQDLEAEPESGLPILQKLLTPQAAFQMVADREARVSGYCHNLLDVSHIATPTVLAEALGQADEPDMVSDEGSVTILRWRAVGPDLYRTPYGGTDEETKAAVSGWVVEEPPFVGMGLVPNVDQLIREYKVDAVELPHGSEIVELTIDGIEVRRAVFDGDRRRWLLATRAGSAATASGDGAAAGEEQQ